MTYLRVIQSLELSILSIFITVFCLTWSSVAQASDYSTLGIFELDGNNWSLEPLTVSNYPINAQVRITYNDGFFTNWDLDDPKPYWGAYAADSISVTDSDGSKSTLFYDDPSIRGYFSDPDELQRRMSNVSPFEFTPSGEAFDLWVWGAPGARADTATNRDGSVKLLVEYTRDVPHDHLPTMPPDTPPSTAMYHFELPFYSDQSHAITQVPGGDTSHDQPFLMKAVDFGPLPEDKSNIKIAASLGGTAWVTENDPDFGNFVTIDHGPDPNTPSSRIFSFYAHLDSVSVQSGTEVATGALLGVEGNTGVSKGIHLHWDVYSGDPQKSPHPFYNIAPENLPWTPIGLNDPVTGINALTSPSSTVEVITADNIENYIQREIFSRLINPDTVESQSAANTFGDSATFIASDTGVIDANGTRVSLTTGSPAWFADRIDIDDPANVLSFDYDFTSIEGSEGLLGVYWDGQLIGTIDERTADAEGLSTIHFLLPGQAEAGLHTVAFRLDPYTDVPSQAIIDHVSAGFSTAIPEPSSLSLLTLAGLILTQRRRYKRVAGVEARRRSRYKYAHSAELAQQSVASHAQRGRCIGRNGR